MYYHKSLLKKQRESIYGLFMLTHKMKFSEIEKELGIRSNEVSYHLKEMEKEGILVKVGDYYQLTKEAERFLPIFTNIKRKTMNPIPVVMVGLVKGDEILLVKRRKRPYKDYWCMIGGTMLSDETVEEAASRLAKDKAGIEGEYQSLNSIVHERILDGDLIKHSFMLFFTKVKVTNPKFTQSSAGELKWVKIKDLKKSEIVPSDYWLMKNKLDIDPKERSIVQFDMKEKDGKLISPKITEL